MEQYNLSNDFDEVLSWAKGKTALSQDFNSELHQYTDQVRNHVISIAKKHDYPIKDAIMAGSASRDTYLPWSVDIDLFACLDVTEKAKLSQF